MASGRSLPSYGAVQEYRDDPNYRDYSDRPGPGFEEQLSAITRNISAINNGANTLEKAARVIGTERDNGQASDKIHQISVDTNKTVNNTTKLLLQFSSRTTERTQRLQIDKVTKDFQESVQRFQTLQKKAAEKAKTVNRQEKSKPKTNWMDDDDDRTQLVADNKTNRRQELQAQEQVIEDDLALIREREDQIRALEGDILDVNEIFRDLGAMIHEQGEQIDTIEANVERAATHVEEGREQLQKASTYQKKSRKKLCCIVMIFVIIAAIIAIILAVTLKK